MRHKQTVLIASTDLNSQQTLALHCDNLDLTVITADTGLTAIMMARKHSPDIMIIDVTVQLADGLKVCERLNELQIAISTVMLTGELDFETAQICKDLGARCVHKDNNMWEKLEPLISELLHSPTQTANNNIERQAPSDNEKPVRTAPLVLAIDDDPDITKALKIRLGFHGIDTIEAGDSRTALMLALREKPDVIITDYRMPEGSGDYLIVRLRQMNETKEIPIIVLTGQSVGGTKDLSLERDLLGRCNASAFLMKPLDFDQLIAELEKYIAVKPLKTFAA